VFYIEMRQTNSNTNQVVVNVNTAPKRRKRRVAKKKPRVASNVVASLPAPRHYMTNYGSNGTITVRDGVPVLLDSGARVDQTANQRIIDASARETAAQLAKQQSEFLASVGEVVHAAIDKVDPNISKASEKKDPNEGDERSGISTHQRKSQTKNPIKVSGTWSQGESSNAPRPKEPKEPKEPFESRHCPIPGCLTKRLFKTKGGYDRHIARHVIGGLGGSPEPSDPPSPVQ
jgi:hypothetical protein